VRSFFSSLLSRFSAHCDYLDIRHQYIETLTIACRDGRPRVRTHLERGVAARALYKGGWGFARCSDPAYTASCVDAAIRQARLLQGAPCRLAPVPVLDVEHLLAAESDPRQAPLAEKVSLLQRYADMAGRYAGSGVGSALHYHERVVLSLFMDTAGSFVYQEIPDISGALCAHARRGANRQSASVSFGSAASWEVVYGHDREWLDAVRLARSLVDAPVAGKGSLPVILAADAAAVLLFQVVSALLHRCRAGASLGDAVPDVPGARELHIYDSALEPSTRGFEPYDAEGVGNRPLTLLKDGRWRNCLHTRESAARSAVPPAGHARAFSYKHRPRPCLHALRVTPGNATLPDILAGVTQGMYAFNPRYAACDGRTYTLSASGYRVHRGRLERLVRDLRLHGSVSALLQHIDGIADAPEIVETPLWRAGGAPGGMAQSSTSPAMRISRAEAGGK